METKQLGFVFMRNQKGFKNRGYGSLRGWPLQPIASLSTRGRVKEIRNIDTYPIGQVADRIGFPITQQRRKNDLALEG